ncbi:MAG: hypothetical protein ACO1OB_09025 [Archangium sp.]
MKWGAVVAVMCSSCASLSPSVETAPSQRMAISTIPTAPQAFSHGPGLGAGVRTLFAQPEANRRSGLGFGVAQFDGGGLLRLGEHTSLGGWLSVAPTAFGTLRPPDSFAFLSQSAAITGALSVGHDFMVHEHLGFTVAADLGLMFVPVFEEGLFTREALFVLPAVTGGASFFADFTYARPFAGVSIGTGPMSEPTGTHVRRCEIICSDESFGVTTVRPLVMLSAGVSVRPVSFLQVNLELLVPLTEDGSRIPVSGAASLRFSIEKPKRAPPPPAEAPPTAPPLVPVEPDVPMTP